MICKFIHYCSDCLIQPQTKGFHYKTSQKLSHAVSVNSTIGWHQPSWIYFTDALANSPQESSTCLQNYRSLITVPMTTNNHNMLVCFQTIFESHFVCGCDMFSSSECCCVRTSSLDCLIHPRTACTEVPSMRPGSSSLTRLLASVKACCPMQAAFSRGEISSAGDRGCLAPENTSGRARPSRHLCKCSAGGIIHSTCGSSACEQR